MKDPIEKEDEMCPLCKSTKYLNPKMILLVSPCYHRLCETCINRLFLHGSAPCPLCATILRKGNFVIPTFGDLKVEKEVRIRKIVSKAFYKREEDFDELKDYNDYLEEVEDIVFNLVNDVNVQSTYARLESFKTENRDTLEKNLARQAQEQRQGQLEETAERVRREESNKLAKIEIQKEQIELEQVKKKLINDLANSSAPAAVILAEAQKTLKLNNNHHHKQHEHQHQHQQSAAVSSSRVKRSATLSVDGAKISNLRQSKRLGAGIDKINEIVFDPLRNIIPLASRLPLLAELDTIPSSLIIDLFVDYLPPAPSSYRDKNWEIEKQMQAAGYSVDLIKKHCVKAALSWGL